MDRQYPFDDHNARHLFGLGEGPPQSLFLRQHHPARARVRVSREWRADPHRPPDRVRLSGPLQHHAHIRAARRHRSRRPDAFLRTLARRAGAALQRKGDELPQRALRLRRRRRRGVPCFYHRSGPGGLDPRHFGAARQPLVLPLCRQQSAIWSEAVFDRSPSWSALQNLGGPGRGPGAGHADRRLLCFPRRGVGQRRGRGCRTLFPGFAGSLPACCLCSAISFSSRSSAWRR